MFFIRWIFSFFYTYEDPITEIAVHGRTMKEELLDIESIKFKAAFDKIQKYNILDETDYDYITKCKNEKMMEYIRNIE